MNDAQMQVQDLQDLQLAIQQGHELYTTLNRQDIYDGRFMGNLLNQIERIECESLSNIDIERLVRSYHIWLTRLCPEGEKKAAFGEACRVLTDVLRLKERPDFWQNTKMPVFCYDVISGLLQTGQPEKASRVLEGLLDDIYEFRAPQQFRSIDDYRLLRSVTDNTGFYLVENFQREQEAAERRYQTRRTTQRQIYSSIQLAELTRDTISALLESNEPKATQEAGKLVQKALRHGGEKYYRETNLAALTNRTVRALLEANEPETANAVLGAASEHGSKSAFHTEVGLAELATITEVRFLELIATNIDRLLQARQCCEAAQLLGNALKNVRPAGEGGSPSSPVETKLCSLLSIVMVRLLPVGNASGLQSSTDLLAFARAYIDGTRSVLQSALNLLDTVGQCGSRAMKDACLPFVTCMPAAALMEKVREDWSKKMARIANIYQPWSEALKAGTTIATNGAAAIYQAVNTDRHDAGEHAHM